MQAISSVFQVVNCSTLEISITLWHPHCISLIASFSAQVLRPWETEEKGKKRSRYGIVGISLINKNCGRLGVIPLLWSDLRRDGMKLWRAVTKLSNTVKGLLIALVISHWQWDHQYSRDIAAQRIDAKSEKVTTVWISINEGNSSRPCRQLVSLQGSPLNTEQHFPSSQPSLPISPWARYGESDDDVLEQLLQARLRQAR